MLGVHIPDVLATGCFTGQALRRVLEPEPSPARAAYEIEYVCATRKALSAYRAHHAPRLQEEHTARYRSRFEASRVVAESTASHGAATGIPIHTTILLDTPGLICNH